MTGNRVRTDGCGQGLGILSEPGRGRWRPAAIWNQGMKKVIELVLEATFQSYLTRHLYGESASGHG